MANCGRPRRRGSSSRPPPKQPKKRTKYLSLSRLIIKSEAEEVEKKGDGPADDDDYGPAEDAGGQRHQQVDPFAPASTLFAAVPAPPSLADILGASADSPSPCVPGDAGFPAAEDEDLARRALRGRERWVYCSRNSSSTSSSSSPPSPCSSGTCASARSLLLKLDYDDILAAWADRGSLYIAHAAPKPDPEELDDVLVEVEPTQHPLPETGAPRRAESVRRYKEKRRNRLFARRVRYEVRRVNAVKRPRFKGRFIKENEGN